METQIIDWTKVVQKIGVGDYGIYVKWKVLGAEKNKVQTLWYVNEATRDSDLRKLKSNSNVSQAKRLGK